MTKLLNSRLLAVRQSPVDGFGGSYYDVPFPVPILNPMNESSVSTSTTWRAIDDMQFTTSVQILSASLCLGLCALTFVYIAALTPPHKRRTLLQTSFLLGLACEMVRLVSEVVVFTRSAPCSAYLLLTQDYSAVSTSTEYRVLGILMQLSACLALLCMQICFFLQARGLLSWVQMRFTTVHLALIAYLLLMGMIAFASRTVLAALQIRDLTLPQPLTLVASHTNDFFNAICYATLVTYSLTIASWSLVFVVSAGVIIVQRRHFLLQAHRPYDSLLNLFVIIGIESLIVPIVLLILQAVPTFSAIINPERFVVPITLCALPFGSLFVSVHYTNDSLRSGISEKGLTASSIGRGPKRCGVPDQNNLIQSRAF